MKHLYILPALILSTFLSIGQISIDSADMPYAGWTQRMAVDRHPANIHFGNSGPNEIYDFSGLAPTDTVVVHYDSLTAAQRILIAADYYISGGIDGPLFTSINSTAYNINAQAMRLAGLDTLFRYNVRAKELYKLPIVYGTADSAYGAFSIDAPDSSFDQPSIAQTVRLRTKTSFVQQVDGWGTLVLPGCAYPCLRMKRTENNRIYIDTLAYRAYIPVDTITFTTTRYYFLTKESRGAALSYSYDDHDSLLEVSWTLNAPPAITPYFSDSNIVAGAFAFTDTSVTSLSGVYWDFGDSSFSSQHSPIHAYSQNGSYPVCLTEYQCGHNAMYCDSIHVTALVADSNYAPVAADDSIGVTQFSTVTVSPMSNDYDPNGDALCIYSVWGGHHGRATIQGCDSIRYTSTDSSFLITDSIYYRVCDNDSLMLCDTALIQVRISEQPPTAIIGHLYGYGSNLAFFCEQGFLRDSSINVSPDSTTIWNIKLTRYYCTNCPDSVTLYGDSSILIYPYTLLPYVWGQNVLYICLTVKNSAGSSTVCDSFDMDCEAVRDIKDNEFRIYPNPVSETLHIDFANMDGNTFNSLASIEVCDLLGQPLMSAPVDDKRMINLRVSNFPNGVYIVNAIDKDHGRKNIGKFNVMK